MKILQAFPRLLILSICWCFLGGIASSPAAEPTEQIRQSTEKILSILADPDLEGPEMDEVREKRILEVVDERFDWEEMGRRTLGRNWSELNETQRSEFISLFRKLLQRTYMDKVEGYSGEEVLYTGERVEDPYAVAEVKIVTEEGTEIPVLYRMKRQGPEWYVYDISIQGVSLVMNYRSQFNGILVRGSYEKLADMLKKKVEQKE